MLLLLGIAFLVAAAQGVPTASRIVGGTPATITEAPHTVALLYDFNNVGVYRQACGGAIIFPDIVITVAQCANNTRASQWRARGGSALHDTGGQVLIVTRYVMHPSFTSRLDNDIALMFLSTRFTLSASVATVTLPAQGLAITEGSIGNITGWGTLIEGGSAPVQLYKVNLPVVNQQQCVSAYAGFNPVTDNMFCAGRIGIGGAGACQGDAGGAFILNRVLVGLTSWGRGCAQPNYPDVLVRVPSYRNWINANS